MDVNPAWMTDGAKMCVDEPYVPNENGPAVLEENEVFDSQYLWKIEEAEDHQGNRVYRLYIRNHLDRYEGSCTIYITPEQLGSIGELFTALSVIARHDDTLFSKGTVQ